MGGAVSGPVDPTPPPDAGTPSSLTAAVRALRRASEALTQVAAARSSGAAPPEPAPGDRPSGPDTPEPDPERELYHEHLRARGALADVTEDADLASLPPSVTHVRYPDGRVRRVGYN
jgi:hypothetical protein